MNMIQVLDPTAKPGRAQREMAIRPTQLEGKILGFLSNNKPNADILRARLPELLGERSHFAQVVQRNSPHSSLSGAGEDLLNELAAKCDVVIVAVAD